MKVQNILQAISEGQFTDAELRQINQVLVARLKGTARAQAQMAKATLAIGMEVKVNHPQLAGRTFILNAIKRTKASVRAKGEIFGGYSVPLNLVEQA
jgi:hypothetical protein